MFKKKHVIKAFVAILFFLGLLFSSEVLYALRSEHLDNIFIYYHLFQINRNIERNDCKKLSLHLVKLSNNIIRFNFNQYSEVYPSLVNASSLISAESLCKSSDLLISGLNRVDLTKTNNFLHIKISYIYYLLGLQSEYYSDSISPDLLTVAIYLNPELSYYHVELANYYLKQGKTDLSNKAIEFCKSFKYARPFCQEYEFDKIEEVGFLHPHVETYLLRFL